MRPYLEGENLYNIINKAIPNFVVSDYPAFVSFINAFIHFLEHPRIMTAADSLPEYGHLANNTTTITETLGGPAYEARKLQEYRDVSTSLDEFQIHFLNLFAKNWPNCAQIPSDLFINSLRQFYQKKGTIETIVWFFRAMFNQDAEVYFPREDVLRTSDGTWIAPITIKVSEPVDGHTNDDLLTYYVGQRIVTATGAAQVERVVTQAYGQAYNRYILVNEITLKFDTIVGTFLRGQDVYNLDSTEIVHSTILPVITGMTINSGGSNYAIGDFVRISEGPGAGGGYGAWGQVGQVTSSTINGVVISDGGGGYVTGTPLDFVSIYGTGAAGYVDTVIFGNFELEDATDTTGYLIMENRSIFQYEDKNTLDLDLTIEPFVGTTIIDDPAINLGIDRIIPTVGTDYGTYADPIVDQMIGVGIDSALEIALAAAGSSPFMHPWVFTSSVPGSETVELANIAATIQLITQQRFEDGDRIFKIVNYADATTRASNSSVSATIIVADHTWGNTSDYVYLSNTGTLLANTLVSTTHIMKASDVPRTIQVGTLSSDGTTAVVGTDTVFTTAIAANDVIRIDDTLHITVKTVTDGTHFIAQTAVGTTLTNAPWSKLHMQLGTLSTNGIANIVGTSTGFTSTLSPNTHIRITDNLHIVVKTVVNNTFFTAQSPVGVALADVPFAIIPMGVVIGAEAQSQRYYGKIRHITITSPGQGYSVPPRAYVDAVSARAQEITHIEP